MFGLSLRCWRVLLILSSLQTLATGVKTSRTRPTGRRCLRAPKSRLDRRRWWRSAGAFKTEVWVTEGVSGSRLDPQGQKFRQFLDDFLAVFVTLSPLRVRETEPKQSEFNFVCSWNIWQRNVSSKCTAFHGIVSNKSFEIRINLLLLVST